MQLQEYSLALISVVLTSHNCNKTNIWTSIADPEEIQNAKKKKKKGNYLFLRYKYMHRKPHISPHRKSSFAYSMGIQKGMGRW